jgi:hypothetical protein
VSGARLRGCPTCATPIDQAAGGLGLRDYRWLSPHLPGKVNPTDIDSVLERNGHFLIQEYKDPGATLHKGQRIMLKHLVRLGMDVLVVWGSDADAEAPVQVFRVDRNGELSEVPELSTAEELALFVRRWLRWATEVGPV